MGLNLGWNTISPDEPFTQFPSVPSSTFRRVYQIRFPVAARSKAWACDASLSGIAGSNPAGGMEVCPLWTLCVVRWRFLRRSDHSSGGVLPTVMCLSRIVKPRKWGGPGPLRGVAPWGKNKKFIIIYPLNHLTLRCYTGCTWIVLPNFQGLYGDQCGAIWGGNMHSETSTSYRNRGWYSCWNLGPGGGGVRNPWAMTSEVIFFKIVHFVFTKIS